MKLLLTWRHPPPPETERKKDDMELESSSSVTFVSSHCRFIVLENYFVTFLTWRCAAQTHLRRRKTHSDSQARGDSEWKWKRAAEGGGNFCCFTSALSSFGSD